ncbi:MAG: diguanylate cyclase [Anaerolineales bacterium]|nr:diguanylate cyclase [Anaerolineales bacterium]
MIERLQRWLSLPTFENSDLRREAEILFSILVVLIPTTAGFVVALMLLAPENKISHVVAITILLSQVCSYILLRRRRLVAAGMGMLSLIWVFVTFSVYLGDGVRSVSVIGQLLIVLMAGLLVKRSFAAGLAALTVLINLVILRLHQQGLRLGSTVLSDEAYWAAQGLFFVVAVGLAYVYIRGLNRAFAIAQAKEDSLRESVEELRQAQTLQTVEKENLHRREAIFATVSAAAERLFREGSFAESINTIAQSLGEATGVDRVRIFENAINPGGELMSHEMYSWSAPNVGSYMQLGRFKSTHFREAGLLRWVDLLSNNQVVKANVQDLPDHERRRLQSQGLKAILVVPILVGDEWWGFIGFDDVKEERSWSPEEEDALRGAAGILGGALQRQRVERALYRSEQQYLAILQDQTDMICRYTPLGQITFANDAYERFFGLQIDETGKRMIWNRVLLEEDRQALQSKIEKITPERPSITTRSHDRREDGALRWIEWTARGIFDENGVLIEVQSAGRDVDNEVHLRQQLERNLRASEEQAMTDELTGLLNRRAITERAEIEWQRALQENLPLSLVLMDLDHLKNINDSHGHLVGDEALRTIGNLLQTSMRRNDWAGRWGGDEFMLLLPGAELLMARQVAERLHQRISRSHVRLEDGTQVQLQVSLGVVSSPAGPKRTETLDELFARADGALYSAKQAGRNQVGIA